MLAVRTPTIALVGNPNTGKTTLFNALAGMKQRVGNYPGVTVETKKGKLRHGDQTIEIIDLPGAYSLAPRSPDEMVAVEIVLGQQAGEERPDLIVAIVDAANLERNLYLTTQVMDLGLPVVIALNMMDVAETQGVRIDAAQLSRNLGVPVVPIQANKGKGLDALKEAIATALALGVAPRGPDFPEPFRRELAALVQANGHVTPEFLLRRALLDVGGQAERWLADHLGPQALETLRAARLRLHAEGIPIPGIEARTRYAWIRQATAGCTVRPAQRYKSWTDALDRVLTHKVWGTLIFLAVMFLVFTTIFAWANPLMELTGGIPNWLADQVKGWMDPGPLRSLITDGILKGVGGVLVFLPQIIILFAFIAILEDCGYMARAAFLMDRLMARCGLNGKSFIPLLSSVACAVPGIMAARVIENRRDRLATILVAPLMSCSARLPVYSLLIAAFIGVDGWAPPLTLFAMYCIGLVVAPLVAFCLKGSLLRGETPPFVMEMPLYKFPSWTQVLHRSLESGWMFVRRAGTLILASMVLVWALLYFPATDPTDGVSFDQKIAALEEKIDEAKEKQEDPAELEDQVAQMLEQWNAQSVLGRVGQGMEPVFRPLGWDWRIGMAALASFPAREVMVGTMGIIFGKGKGDAKDEEYRAGLGDQLRAAKWTNDPTRPLFTLPVALSVMVFFALCCQCASTLAVIRRETNSWSWPAFTFVYMTVLAYVGAFVTYQVGSLFVS